jgi:hypothetical protein
VNAIYGAVIDFIVARQMSPAQTMYLITAASSKAHGFNRCSDYRGKRIQPLQRLARHMDSITAVISEAHGLNYCSDQRGTWIQSLQRLVWQMNSIAAAIDEAH